MRWGRRRNDDDVNDDDAHHRRRHHHRDRCTTRCRTHATLTQKSSGFFVFWHDDDDDDDDDEQEEESASTLVRRAVMAARRREDDETQALFSSYPAPTTVERQRRARERVTAALRKLKIERNLEKTPDVFGGYETKTRRRSHAVGDDSDARGRYATRCVSATEKEHFMSTPSSTPGSNRRSHSWNSISSNNAKKAGVSPVRTAEKSSSGSKEQSEFDFV